MKVSLLKLTSKFRSSTQVFLTLLFIWTLTFYLHERFIPYFSVRACHWPHLDTRDGDGIKQGDQEQDQVASKEIFNVMFIADPQLIDNHTYPGRNELLLRISKHTADVYLKRNYNALMGQLAPSHLFFLGDYLDNGRSASDAYFDRELKRFKNIFHSFKKIKKYFNVVGNHDIGWADGVKVKSRKRFKKHFGDPNHVKRINNVDFVMLDTSSLSSSNEEINSNARKFLEENFGQSIVKSNPRILLTHVPLYRDPKSNSCGPLRESSVFNLGAGYQYQSALQPDISQELLEKIKPDLIFSGDDHDYCDVQHSEVDNLLSREITVKSISMAMGIRYPAVQLLSFAVDQDPDTLVSELRYDTQICYLQRPYINIVSYVLLAVLSAALVFWSNARAHPSRYSYSVLPSLHTDIPLSSSPSGMSATVNFKKINKFLREQDDSSPPISTLPFRNYTSPQKSSKMPKKLVFAWRKFTTYAMRWNAYASIRHCIIYGLTVVSVYYFGFCHTL